MTDPIAAHFEASIVDFFSFEGRFIIAGNRDIQSTTGSRNAMFHAVLTRHHRYARSVPCNV
jgi:hypothetical protein